MQCLQRNTHETKVSEDWCMLPEFFLNINAPVIVKRLQTPDIEQYIHKYYFLFTFSYFHLIEKF